MSQASLSKVRAALRHREQVAREIMHGLPWAPMGDGHSVRPPYLWSTGRFAALAGPDDLLSGDVTFDVHAAREHARGLVSLADEQAVFEDWTRARGLGPENREPGAFGVKWCGDCGVMAEPAEGHCFNCGGDAWLGGGWPGKLAREWPGDSRAPMGRSLARLGRRILDALEGQPSDEWAYAYTMGERDRLEALNWAVGEWTRVGGVKIWPMSRHNLRGVLPPIEWSPAVRRRRLEALQRSERRALTQLS